MTNVRTVHTRTVTVWLNSLASSDSDTDARTTVIELEEYVVALRAAGARDGDIVEATHRAPLNARLSATFPIPEATPEPVAEPVTLPWSWGVGTHALTVRFADGRPVATVRLGSNWLDLGDLPFREAARALNAAADAAERAS